MKKSLTTYLSRAGTVIFVLFAVLVFYRMYVLERAKQTAVQVARIHATKLTLNDVMGKNLPPVPASPDATIAGVDANKNGIRDDVELAIFQTYPDSAKIRSPLLQYALALQTEMTLQLVNGGTVSATIEDLEGHADVCLWSLSSRSDMTKFIADVNKYRSFVEKLQLNSTARTKYLKDLINNNLQSGGPSDGGCDIQPTTLPN
ncbi:MAG: hypothetical protein WC764_03390 [Candidatus Paceibacterota bacterium]|jgi:hypothetical protein